MSMRTLAVISRKGGAGKTTLSTSLAVSAWRAGLKAILVDLDPQRSAALWGRTRATPAPAVVSTTAGKLFPVWSAAENAGCDLMLLDTPAGGEDEALQAVRLADLCLLVCRPNVFDVDALQQSLGLVQRQGKPHLVVLNQAPPRRLGQESEVVGRAIADLQAQGARLAETGLRHRAAFPAAAAGGISVEEIDPDRPAAREVAGVWAQVWKLLQASRTAPAPRRPAPPRFKPREVGMPLGA
ncbi:MAG TPA: ParA family protein [Caulobacteraceae bacterium]|jgi:chromosome partitioning protein